MDARELVERDYERWLRTGELPVDLLHGQAVAEGDELGVQLIDRADAAPWE